MSVCVFMFCIREPRDARDFEKCVQVLFSLLLLLLLCCMLFHLSSADLSTELCRPHIWFFRIPFCVIPFCVKRQWASMWDCECLLKSECVEVLWRILDSYKICRWAPSFRAHGFVRVKRCKNEFIGVPLYLDSRTLLCNPAVWILRKREEDGVVI